MTDTTNFGRTPGFWKNHVDIWGTLDAWFLPGQTTPQTLKITADTSFEAVFGVNLVFANEGAGGDLSFLEALSGGGGGINALARHATAALLNASVDEDLPKFGLSKDNYLLYQFEDVLLPTKLVLTSVSADRANDIEDLKNIYDYFNNLQGYEQVAGTDVKSGFFADIFELEASVVGWDDFLNLSSSAQFALIDKYIDPI